MENFFRKGLLTGVGIGLMTKEKIEQAARKIAEDAKMSEDETKKFVAELKKSSDKTREEVESHIQEQIREAVRKMGLVTKSDFEELKKQIDGIQESLHNIGGAAAETADGKKESAKTAGRKAGEKKKNTTDSGSAGK